MHPARSHNSVLSNGSILDSRIGGPNSSGMKGSGSRYPADRLTLGQKNNNNINSSLPPQRLPQQNQFIQHYPPQNHPPQNHPQQNHPQQNHPQQNHPQQNHPPQNHPPPHPQHTDENMRTEIIIEKPVYTEKIVEKPIYIEKEKIVEKPVYIDRPVTVEKRVEVPVEKIVYKDKIIEKVVEKIVYKDKIIEKPVERIVFKDKIIEKPVEKIVFKDKIIEKPIEKIVYKDKIIEKPIEKIVYKDKIIEKPVEKIVYKDKFVEKIVEVPVEKIVYHDRQVEKKVENQVDHAFVENQMTKITSLVMENTRQVKVQESSKVELESLKTKIKNYESCRTNDDHANKRLIDELEYLKIELTKKEERFNCDRNEFSSIIQKRNDDQKDINLKNQELTHDNQSQRQDLERFNCDRSNEFSSIIQKRNDDQNDINLKQQELMHDNESQRQDKEGLSRELSDKKSSYNDLEIRLAGYRNEVETERLRISTTLKQTETELIDQKQGNSNLQYYQIEYNRMLDDNHKLAERCKQLSDQMESQSNRRKELDDENRSLLQKLNELEEMRIRWMADRDQLAQEISEGKDQVLFYGRECQEKERDVERVRNEGQKMNDEVARQSDLLDRMSTELDQWKHRVSLKEQECLNFQNELNMSTQKIVELQEEEILARNYEEKILIMKSENEKMADYIRQRER